MIHSFVHFVKRTGEGNPSVTVFLAWLAALLGAAIDFVLAGWVGNGPF